MHKNNFRKVHFAIKVNDRMDLNGNVTLSLPVEQIKLLEVLTFCSIPADTRRDASLWKAVLRVALCRSFVQRVRCCNVLHEYKGDVTPSEKQQIIDMVMLPPPYRCPFVSFTQNCCVNQSR